MNKFIRTMLIIFAVCLALGGGLLIAGMALGGTWDDATVEIGDDEYDVHDMFDHGLFKFEGSTHDSDDSDAPESVNKLVGNADDIRGLEITLRSCDFEILTSEDDQIRVEVEDGADGFSLKVKEKTLRIIDTRKNKGNLKAVRIKLWIPEDCVFDHADITFGAGNMQIARLEADEIDIEGGAGKITAETLIANRELDVETGAGDFYIGKAKLGETDIECGVGRFEIGSCTLNGDAEISGGVGDVNVGIVGGKEDFNYELSSGIGELQVFDDSYTALGRDKEIDNGARYTLSLDCGVGRISVYQAGESL